MKYSPIEQPAYGAMYCSGADSDAVAATMHGVIHRAVLRERLGHLCNGRALLADGDIDTDNVLALLVDDGVEADRGLAGLAVADDQLTLAAADRDHGVDRLDAGLERHVDRSRAR